MLVLPWLLQSAAAVARDAEAGAGPGGRQPRGPTCSRCLPPPRPLRLPHPPLPSPDPLAGCLAGSMKPLPLDEGTDCWGLRDRVWGLGNDRGASLCVTCGEHAGSSSPQEPKSCSPPGPAPHQTPLLLGVCP